VTRYPQPTCTSEDRPHASRAGLRLGFRIPDQLSRAIDLVLPSAGREEAHIGVIVRVEQIVRRTEVRAAALATITSKSSGPQFPFAEHAPPHDPQEKTGRIQR